MAKYDNLISLLKENQIHVWTKKMAGVEEIYFEGRIENLEKLLKTNYNKKRKKKNE
jgi:hypothetical protein